MGYRMLASPLKESHGKRIWRCSYLFTRLANYVKVQVISVSNNFNCHLSFRLKREVLWILIWDLLSTFMVILTAYQPQNVFAIRIVNSKKRIKIQLNAQFKEHLFRCRGFTLWTYILPRRVIRSRYNYPMVRIFFNSGECKHQINGSMHYLRTEYHIKHK